MAARWVLLPPTLQRDHHVSGIGVADEMYRSVTLAPCRGRKYKPDVARGVGLKRRTGPLVRDEFRYRKIHATGGGNRLEYYRSRSWIVDVNDAFPGCVSDRLYAKIPRRV